MRARTPIDPADLAKLIAKRSEMDVLRGLNRKPQPSSAVLTVTISTPASTDNPMRHALHRAQIAAETTAALTWLAPGTIAQDTSSDHSDAVSHMPTLIALAYTSDAAGVTSPSMPQQPSASCPLDLSQIRSDTAMTSVIAGTMLAHASQRSAMEPGNSQASTRPRCITVRNRTNTQEVQTTWYTALAALIGLFMLLLS